MNLLKLVHVNLPSLKQETKLIFKIQNMEVIKHYCKRYGIPFNYNTQELAGSSDNAHNIQNGLLEAIMAYVHDQSHKLRGKVVQNQIGAPPYSRNKENIPLNNQPESTIQFPQFVYQTPQKKNSACQEAYYQSAQQFANPLPQIYQSAQFVNPIHQSQMQIVEPQQIFHNSQASLASIDSVASVRGSKTKEQLQEYEGQMFHQDVPRIGFQTQLMMNSPQQFNTAQISNQKSNQKNHSSLYFASQESISQNDISGQKKGQSDIEEIAEMINNKVDQLGCTERFLPLLKEANAIAQNNLSLLYCFIIDILCTEDDFELLKMRQYLVQAYQIPQEYSQPFSYGQRIYY
ncbi:hypothetical protein pb186bvf_018300 [Paramecium bursaria]